MYRFITQKYNKTWFLNIILWPPYFNFSIQITLLLITFLLILQTCIILESTVGDNKISKCIKFETKHSYLKIQLIVNHRRLIYFVKSTRLNIAFVKKNITFVNCAICNEIFCSNSKFEKITYITQIYLSKRRRMF
jgi:hypothetical protein